MKSILDLFAAVAHRVQPPVCIAHGPPWPAANLAHALGFPDTVCYQMDLHQALRVRECLEELGTLAEVVALPDLWDLELRFQTVLFPASAHADRELKIDIIEQAYHILKPGGTFIALSDYEKDNQFARWQKKVFGKCGATPSSESGMVFWSTKTDDGPRRRHEVSFHARLADGPAMQFLSRPGTFSYGRFDHGSRALIDVVETQPGDSILDLGCGNGAVGCLLATGIGPNGSVTFIDSNLRALQLAEMNAKANGVPNPRFVAATRLEGLEPKSFNAIVANPPYYAKSDITRLFVEGAKGLLKRGGLYAIVTKMPTAVVPMIFETFGDCSVIENRGYSVVLANA